MSSSSCICYLLCLCILNTGCNKESCSKDVADDCYRRGPLLRVVTPHGNVTEGLHWDYTNEWLIFVDQDLKTLNKYDPKTGRITTTHLGDSSASGGNVGVCVPVDDECGCGPNSFVCGIGHNLTLVQWDGVSSKPSAMETLQTVEEDKPANRFNDGKADCKGVLWIGTWSIKDPSPYANAFLANFNQANLYHYSRNKCSLKKDLSGITVSNGIAWNKKYTKMYYIDTFTRKIFVFDYDLSTSSISNKQTAFAFEDYNVPGAPDGMTIDTEDNLWVGCPGGYRVIRIDPRSGKLLFTIMFPVENPTSCTFGGPNLDVLYVTSARRNMTDEQLALQPLAGSVFAVCGLKAKGRPANNAMICC